MTGHLRAHLTHLAVGGIGLLALLVMFGVRFPQALTWALLLACPLGMMGMMWFMGRNGHGHGQDHGHVPNGPAEQVPDDGAHAARPVTADVANGVPTQRGRDR